MSDDKDSGLVNWIAKAIVIGIIVGVFYWFFSPQLRCERSFMEGSPIREISAIAYCMEDNLW